MEAGELALIGVLVAVAAYVVLVNRRLQRYAAQTVFDAPLDEVWRLHDLRPGQIDWVPMVSACDWVDEPAQDMRVTYSTGAEMRMRILASEPKRLIVTEARARPTASAEFGDHLRSRTELAALDDGRTRVDYVIDVERVPGLSTFAMRLNYPIMLRYSARLMRKSLAARGVSRPATAGRRALGIGWQLALVAATIAWLIWLVGVWAGLGALAMLLIHEYGHVWSMRRHGHETARLYLVPFFGGVAIGSRAFRSEAEAVEIFLMGPIFGLVPSLVSLVLFAAGGDPFWASLAGFLAICNGLNLAPIPPLDGGRVTQSLMRPLGDKAWYAISGALALAGAAIAAHYRLPGLLFVALISIWAWSSSRGPSPETRPLSASGWTVAFVAYLVLLAAHVGLFLYALSLDGGGGLEQGPAFLRDVLSQTGEFQ